MYVRKLRTWRVNGLLADCKIDKRNASPKHTRTFNHTRTKRNKQTHTLTQYNTHEHAHFARNKMMMFFKTLFLLYALSSRWPTESSPRRWMSGLSRMVISLLTERW
jgi:hypothetical protein